MIDLRCQVAQLQLHRPAINSTLTLEQITADRLDLYSYMTSPGTNIPISVKPAPVDESVPTEDEIEGAVNIYRETYPGGCWG